MTRRKEVAKIRKIIKSKCPNVNVRMGRGTARSWIHLTGKGKYGDISDSSLKCLRGMGVNTPVLDYDDQKAILDRYG